ncbi:hypothetical protein MKW94_028499 [Papaver nudicaule]|uniref:Fe2OG dioxygenase domain-containing protein n=1 Tax=Papaver nudicaule TaxID=74823 RepID=A0AA41RXS1_PAPNU|nr:hypothetical protein [Papaver nudicaule]
MNDKAKYGQKEGDAEGFGQHFVQSDDQRLDWADLFFMVTLPIPLRETLESYSSEMNKLAMILFDMMEKALQVVEAKIMKRLVIGLTPHSDFAGLTILLHVNEVEGLQIRKEGKWISVKPLPNAFVVNIGDVLEILTNGIYRSIEHRATINSAKKRLSIATFHDPKPESEIGPISSLVTPQTPAVFGTAGYEELAKKVMLSKLYGKSSLDCMRIGESD